MMYFIEIATLTEAGEFTQWMKDKGKALSFNDSIGFKEWLERYNTFPLQFYMNGLTYEFKDGREINFFMIGFEAGLLLRIDE